MTMSPSNGTKWPIVLIVDDSKDIRQLFAYFSELLGCSTVGAGNGQEALHLMQNGLKPDLILLDLMMPVMDGWQMDQILADNPEWAEIPTVVVSAFAERAHELKRTHEVVQKPPSGEMLKKVVKKYCFQARASH
jgi:CheY-like chemotaxis protein